MARLSTTAGAQRGPLAAEVVGADAATLAALALGGGQDCAGSIVDDAGVLVGRGRRRRRPSG